MSRKTDSSPNTARASSTVVERRRHPRSLVCAPVTLRCGDAVVEGYTENLSYSGVLVQSLIGMLPVGAECSVWMDMPSGMVEARGTVVRVDEVERTLALDLQQVDENGDLLLVALLT